MIATEDRTPLEGFEQRLLDELLAEAAALPPAPQAAVPLAPPRRRRRARRLALAGVVATGAAFGAFAILPSAERTARLTGGGALGRLPAVTPEPASAAEVRTRSVAAMQRYSDAIIHAVQIMQSPNGSYRDEMWFDEAHPDRFRSLHYGDDGTPAVDGAMRGGTDGQPHRTRTIDFTARTWSQIETDAPREAAKGGKERIPRSLAFAAREMLDEGHLKLLEHTTARGRDALVLLHDEPGMHRKLVIDAETYLPIQMTANWAPGANYVIDYSWLDRTAETEALLWPEPPAAFRREYPAPKADPEGEAKTTQLGSDQSP